ncbi:hypothetical protein NDU88_001987 [Pleurodeles waltl]|uniref:Uncharacterized protein n=1 Tax=Pleurodeles waltl TaxID=8319 RepID=A0AAV7TJD9_PLEWA|nr:hypothetical protein NDU88_001987 [Pleurodeles waltl]
MEGCRAVEDDGWILASEALDHPVERRRSREAIISLIYKRGDRGSPSNYRLISLMDGAMKVLEKALFNRLQDWVDAHNIMTKVQAGVQSRIGTIDQAL